MKRTFRPLFSYFGGKWKHAARYPAPEHDTIVEPFAGAAGYATNYFRRKVILVEKSPVIAALWRYLIAVSPEEVRRLPLLRAGEKVSDVPGLCPEARTLVGLRIGQGSQAPRDTASPWGADNWDEGARETLARQVELIRHWKIIEGDYSSAPDIEATWFIDPPYQVEGFRYTASGNAIDFPELGRWCRSRKGLVMVCENEGADWLPFVPFFEMSGATRKIAEDGRRTAKKSVEVVWTNRTAASSDR